jgi:hypothetical protein
VFVIGEQNHVVAIVVAHAGEQSRVVEGGCPQLADIDEIGNRVRRYAGTSAIAGDQQLVPGPEGIGDRV